MYKKQGFSLVEVMIIFTVFSVILAASLPMITKKTNPVPTKIPHGVYRCIHTNGGLLEELYSGTRQISSDPVARCTFDVPEAAQYKIDMYSAGSGGTEFAQINGKNDDGRSATFTMSDGLNKANNKDPLFTPSDNELVNMFNGLYVVRSLYTGDAGHGSTGDMVYENPYEADCGVDLSVVRNELNKKKAELKEAKALLKTVLTPAKLSEAAGYNFYPASWKTNGWLTAIWHDWSNEDNLTVCDPDHGYEGLDNWWCNTNGYNNFISKYYSMNASGKDSVYIVFYLKWFDISSLPNTVATLVESVRKELSTIPNVDTRKLDRAATSTYYHFIGDLNAIKDYGAIRHEYDDDASYYDCLGDIGNAAFVYPQLNDRVWVYGFGGRGDLDAPPPWYGGNYCTTHCCMLREDYPDHGGQFQFGMPHCANTIKGGAGIRPKALIDVFMQAYNSQFTQEELNAEENINKLEKEIADLESELDSKNSSLLKNNFYANPPRNPNYRQQHGIDMSDPTFNEIYNNPKYVVNDEVRAQVQDFCRVAFKNYYELSGKTPEQTVKFGQKRVAKYGADGGKGAYSRLVYKIDYEQGLGSNIDFSEYIKRLVTTGDIGGYYPQVALNGNSFQNVELNNGNIYTIPKAYNAAYKYADFSMQANNRNIFSFTSNIGSSVNFGYQLASLNVRKLAITNPGGGVGKDHFSQNEEYIPESTRHSGGGTAGAGGAGSSGSSGSGNTGSGSGTSTSTGSHTLATELYTLIADRGDNQTANLRWHISQLGLQNNNSSIVDVIDSNAEGGQPAKITVASNNLKYKTKTINNKFDAYKFFDQNYAYTANDESPASSSNVRFKNQGKRNNYSINSYNPDNSLRNDPISTLDPSSSHTIWQEPSLLITSKLWRKSYKLGGAGNPGQQKSFTVANLGNQCTFNIPAGGEPFEQGTTRANLSKMNASLTTSMQCKNSSDKVVFKEEVGNNYTSNNIEDVSSSKNYVWSEANEAKGEHKVGPDNAAQGQKWGLTSLWAKIYKNFMSTTNKDYDLNSYNIGKAGEGTTLTDKCLTRRGSYTEQMKYDTKYITIYQNASKTADVSYTNNLTQQLIRTERQFSVNNKTVSLGTKEIPFEQGNFKGVNCYGVDQAHLSDKNYQSATKNITTDSEEHKRGIMTLKAQPGGGGAVVITW